MVRTGEVDAPFADTGARDGVRVVRVVGVDLSQRQIRICSTRNVVISGQQPVTEFMGEQLGAVHRRL